MAILATERVLTLDYWKFARDLSPGDIVFDSKGNPVTVKLVQDYRAQRCYEVLFTDNLTVAGDASLTLPIADKKYRVRAGVYKNKRPFRRPTKQFSAEFLLEAPLKDKFKRAKYSVGTVNAIELPYQDLPIPPFVLGYWFYSGMSRKTISAPHQNVDWVKEKCREVGYRTGPTMKYTKARSQFTLTPWPADQLKPLSLHKIPKNYLLSSPEQRFLLLQGIMAAKDRQYNKKIDRFQFSSKYLHEVQQVQFLAESLGCRTRLEQRAYLDNYTVSFKTKLQLIPDQNEPSPIRVRQSWRPVKEVYEIEPQQCVHVELDGQDPHFLVGEGFISCH